MFLIQTGELVEFYKDRNLIAHDFFRLFHTRIRGGKWMEDPKGFLLGFLERCTYWQAVLSGLLCELRSAAAIKERRQSEHVLSPADLENMRVYHEHVAKFLNARSPAK